MFLNLKCCLVKDAACSFHDNRKLRASEGTAPICNVTLKARKPSISLKISQSCQTWGDYLKKARLERGLSQQEVVRIIGVPWSTYRSWERNLWGPRPWHLPSIIKFLGYDPYASASTGLGDQLKFYRRTHGLTQQQLANIFNIHIATLRRWERDTRPLTQKIKTLIETACSDRQIKEGG